ncbi:hypothetical protein GCM10009624_05330 [Gordonia sinesedis]
MLQSPDRRRSRRVVVALALVALGVGGLLVGCDNDNTAPRGLPFGQESLPAPVPASPGSAVADAPRQLTVAGRSAPVDAVKTRPDGALVPPTDVRRVAWWVDSGVPGSGRGTVVITGHINDVRQGVGFASSFVHLKIGDRVMLAGERTEWTYRVTAVRSYDKRDQLPVGELNRLDGPERLALVTCGGAFIGPPFGYQDNDIAWADRVPG